MQNFSRQGFRNLSSDRQTDRQTPPKYHAASRMVKIMSVSDEVTNGKLLYVVADMPWSRATMFFDGRSTQADFFSLNFTCINHGQSINQSLFAYAITSKQQTKKCGTVLHLSGVAAPGKVLLVYTLQCLTKSFPIAQPIALVSRLF